MTSSTRLVNASDGISSPGHHDFSEDVFCFRALPSRALPLQPFAQREENAQRWPQKHEKDLRLRLAAISESSGAQVAALRQCRARQQVHRPAPAIRATRQAQEERIRHCEGSGWSSGPPKERGNRPRTRAACPHRAARTIPLGQSPWKCALRRDDRRYSSHQRRP